MIIPIVEANRVVIHDTHQIADRKKYKNDTDRVYLLLEVVLIRLVLPYAVVRAKFANQNEDRDCEKDEESHIRGGKAVVQEVSHPWTIICAILRKVYLCATADDKC